MCTAKCYAAVIDAVGYRAPLANSTSLLGEPDRFYRDLSSVVDDAVNTISVGSTVRGVLKWEFAAKSGQKARIIVYLDEGVDGNVAMDALVRVVSHVQFNALKKIIVTSGVITYGTMEDLAGMSVDSRLPRVVIERIFASPVFFDGFVSGGFLRVDEDKKTYVAYVDLNKDYDTGLNDYRQSVQFMADNCNRGFVDVDRMTGLSDKLVWFVKERERIIG